MTNIEKWIDSIKVGVNIGWKSRLLNIHIDCTTHSARTYSNGEQHWLRESIQ
jgi:hypothetical protein